MYDEKMQAKLSEEKAYPLDYLIESFDQCQT
jgi:hypothetical protein